MEVISIAEVGFGWKKALKFILFFILFTALLISPISVYIKTHDIGAATYDLGKVIMLSTQKLAEESNIIIKDGGVIDFSKGFIIGISQIFMKYFALLSALGMTFLWFKIFTYPFTRNSISLSATLGGYFLGFMIFYMFQIVFILGNAGINHEITGIIGENSVSYYISLPVIALISFIKVLPLLIKPIIQNVK